MRERIETIVNEMKSVNAVSYVVGKVSIYARRYNTSVAARCEESKAASVCY